MPCIAVFLKNFAVTHASAFLFGGAKVRLRPPLLRLRTLPHVLCPGSEICKISQKGRNFVHGKKYLYDGCLGCSSVIPGQSPVAALGQTLVGQVASALLDEWPCGTGGR